MQSRISFENGEYRVVYTFTPVRQGDVDDSLFFMQWLRRLGVNDWRRYYDDPSYVDYLDRKHTRETCGAGDFWRSVTERDRWNLLADYTRIYGKPNAVDTGSLFFQDIIKDMGSGVLKGLYGETRGVEAFAAYQDTDGRRDPVRLYETLSHEERCLLVQWYNQHMTSLTTDINKKEVPMVVNAPAHSET